MRGLLGSAVRATQKIQVERLAATARIEAHVPAYTNCTALGCGFDDFTASGKNPSCAICRGTGRVATERIGILYGRGAWIDATKFKFYEGMPTGEVGDVSVQCKLLYRNLIEQVYRVDGATLLIDGKHVKPIAIIPNRVEAPTSLDVRCVLTGLSAEDSLV